jgi:DNA-binding PadR family transcriptional regulator
MRKGNALATMVVYIIHKQTAHVTTIKKKLGKLGMHNSHLRNSSKPQRRYHKAIL